MHSDYPIWLQVRGVKPLSLPEMANLFNSLRLMVTPGLVSRRLSCILFVVIYLSWFKFVVLFQDPNPNNLVASTTFHSESTQAMVCLVRFCVHLLFLAAAVTLS